MRSPLALELARRDALWAIKPLRDQALPLFAAADARDGVLSPEVVEPSVARRPMTEGREVVEDYGHVGLTLRRHPVAFLREALERRGVVPCAEADRLQDGRRCKVAGLVLVRQKPGSAKGVMFITIEDETGVANLVIWPTLFEKQRRIVLSSGMIAVDGRIHVRARPCTSSPTAWRISPPSCAASAERARRRLSSRPRRRGHPRRRSGPARSVAAQGARHLCPRPSARLRHQGPDPGLQMRMGSAPGWPSAPASSCRGPMATTFKAPSRSGR